MPKVTMIGAGSAVFARQIITDVLAVDGLDGGTFALVDIDAKRLDLARRISQRLVELSGKGWKVVASTDRTEVLPGTDYVVNSIEVAGLQNVRADYDIPLRYGVDQCIGDTIGPGGIFKALRTGPAWLDIVADAQRLAPRAMILTSSHEETQPPTPIMHGALELAPVEIGDGSDVGLGAILLPGTRLGAGVLVGAGAVVKGEFPDGAVLAGVPARVLRSRAGS